MRREEEDAAELVDVATADVIAAPAEAAHLRPVLAAAVDEPLNAVDGYEVLERAPDNRQPGAVKDITQGEAAVRPKREEKGEEYEHSSAQIAEELRKRHRPARGPEDQGERKYQRSRGSARADQSAGRAQGALNCQALTFEKHGVHQWEYLALRPVMMSK